MKRNMKSVLALLLALCMAMSLLCTSVWAAEEDASDESAAAVEVQEAEAAAAEEESAPEEEEPAPEAEAEEEAPAEEPELETQAPAAAAEPDDFYPTKATATLDGNAVTVKVTHGNISFNLDTRTIIYEGRDLTAGGSWKECVSESLSNARGYNGGTPYGSKDGSWGDLQLVSGNRYEFRVCYTKQDGTRTAYATTEPITYYSTTQEQAKLDEAIKTALASGKGDIAAENYDGETLSLGTQFVYQRPLYTMFLSVKGSEGSTVQFHVEILPKFANNINYNGIEKDGPGYVEGVDYYLDSYYYVGEYGETYRSDVPHNAQDANFSVDFSNLAFGCNYLKLRLRQDVSGECKVSGLDEEYVTEEPFCFNYPVGGSVLTANSAASTKDSISFGKMDTITNNVTEHGMVIQYRKKGDSSWSKKTFLSGSTMKISGLKANTVYEWNAQMYLKSIRHDNGEETTMWSPATNTFTVRTADKNKPAVKSYKISGIKYQKHQIDAHWESTGSGFKWVKTKTWYTTEYTMKITFKSVPKGVCGYWLNKGTYAGTSLVKVKGKTITVKCSTNGKSKGKKTSIYLESCTNTNGTGRGPALKYTYTIK